MDEEKSKCRRTYCDELICFGLKMEMNISIEQKLAKIAALFCNWSETNAY